MTDTTITCPKCGADIPLTEAVSHRLREELAADFENQRAELNTALKKREDQLEGEKEALEKRARSVEDEIAKKLEAERAKLAAAAARQAEAKMGTELKDLQGQLAEQRDRLKAAQDAELGLRKEKRQLEDAKAAMELDVARKVDEERKKIAADTRQQTLEGERLKMAEKEQIIKGLQEQIEALKQRAEQGSMQLQGEVLELELERILGEAFPGDEIAEIKKGQRGADVLQVVRTGAGMGCGAILWEAKRAKNWAPDWIAKLKDDQREAKAELAVLVTTRLPDGLRGLGQVEGVWVCEPPFAAVLATALRQGLIQAAVQRSQETGRTDKMSRVYDFLCSVEFRQHIEGIVESFKALQEQLGAEQRAFARQWKEREQQILKAIQHTAMVYGSIQGIAGRNALPEIAPLQLPNDAQDAQKV